jgi:hypothetical protein
MLRTSLLAACAAMSLAVIAVGCTEETKQTPPPPPVDETGIVPPTAPEGAAACADPGSTQAVNELFLGDTKRDGTPDPTNGWKTLGYNLDGLKSLKTSTNLCKPRAGGSAAAVYPDGTEGIDNSFGKNILPIILGLASDLSTTANESIQKGEFTLMLDLSKLGRDCTGASAKLFAGTQLVDSMGMEIVPKFDGTDEWPVSPDLLNNPMDPTSSKIVFPQAYVAGNTWVSGTKGTVSLQLSISGFTVSLDIQNAYVTLDLADGNASGTNGTIAGVLDTEQLVSQIGKVAAAFDTSFCDPESPTLVSILNQLRQASDIMKDGSQDPSKECDGISIGLGFNTKAVKLGPVAKPGAPPPDPCGAGGAGGGGGAGGAGGGP